MLKKMYKDVIEQSSLEDASNEIFRGYLKDKEVPILGEGELVDMDYDPEKLFKFKVKYEVKPNIEVKDVFGSRLKKFQKLMKYKNKFIESDNVESISSSLEKIKGNAADDGAEPAAAQ